MDCDPLYVVMSIVFFLLLALASPSPTASGERPGAQRGDGLTPDGRSEGQEKE